MSLRTSSPGLGTILASALLVAVAATADDTAAKRVVTDRERALSHPQPPALGQPSTWQQQAEQGEKQELLPPADGGAARNPRPRVLVRDLRDRAAPRDRALRYDSRAWWARSPEAFLRFPYDCYYECTSYPQWRRLAETYRALRYLERKQRERRFNRRDMAARKKRLLDRHAQALEVGLRHLKEGHPARAIVALTLAAKLDQGDPACRIHLAQARLAQGHYREASLALRRALQLQPRLVYADLHLQEYYQTKAALGRYIDGLTRWAELNAPPPEVHFLLGFLEFQRGAFEAAHAAFERVAEVLPRDDLTRAYLEITKPANTE